MKHAARGAVLAALVIPLVAFAGTLPWGSSLAVIVAVLACACVSGEPPAHAPLAWLFAGIAVLAAVQAIPLPLPVLGLLSPGAARVWRAPPGFGSGTLSLAPWDSVGVALVWAAAAALHFATARLAREKWGLAPFLTIAVALGLLSVLERVTPLSIWRGGQNVQGLGPFPNRNDLAAMCASALPLAAAGLMRGGAGGAAPGTNEVHPPGKREAVIIGWGGSIAVLGAIIAGSGSRVGAIAALAGVSVFLVALKSKRGRLRIRPQPFLFLLLALALAVGLFRGVLPSSEGLLGETGVRMSVWASAVRLFASFPVFGCGLGAFAFSIPLTGHDASAGHPFHAESDLLELVAEGGIVLLAISAVPLWRWAKPLWLRAREGSTTAAAALGAAAAVAVASLGTFTITGSPALLLWAAAITALGARSRETGSRAAVLLPLLFLVPAGGRLGGALHFSTGRTQEAAMQESRETSFQRAVRWDPRHPAASLELARRSAEEAFSSPAPWEDEGDALERAGGWYLRRLAMRPTDPNARLGLASVCDALGRRPGGNSFDAHAVALRKSAVAMDKANPAVAPYERAP